MSVDAKKQERVGPFANGGRDSQPQGQPERVRPHDFPDKQLGKMCPYLPVTHNFRFRASWGMLRTPFLSYISKSNR
jgi:hypothetical protein